MKMPDSARVVPRPDDDVDVAAEHPNELEKSLGRETGDAPSKQRRHFRLIDAEAEAGEAFVAAAEASAASQALRKLAWR